MPCYGYRMPKTRRTVITATRAPRGGRTKLWGYSYEDIARICGVQAATVRQAAKRLHGQPAAIDPADLGSVVRYVVRHRPDLIGEG
jgi:hypothetical protein